MAFKSYLSRFEIFLLLSRQKRGTEVAWELALSDSVGSSGTRELAALETLSAEEPGC